MLVITVSNIVAIRKDNTGYCDVTFFEDFLSVIFFRHVSLSIWSIVVEDSVRGSRFKEPLEIWERRIRRLTNDRASITFIILGLVGITDSIFVLALNGGINLGTLLPGFLGVALLFWGLRKEYLKRHFLKNRFLWVRRLVRLSILMLLVSFIFIESLLLYNTKDPVSSQVNYLIILGAGLNGDKLSWTLWERVDKGLRILQDNKDMKVVVSGGKGPGEWITEAEAMQNYLVEQGIAKERIIKEEKSTSTMENFRYARELLGQQSGYAPSEPVLVITNDFHMFRSKILARRNGLNPVGVPSPTPWYLRPNVYLREYFALVKSLVFDW